MYKNLIKIKKNYLNLKERKKLLELEFKDSNENKELKDSYPHIQLNTQSSMLSLITSNNVNLK